ncbi:hypothetical protein F4Z99_17880 [Candidatus Poribacteria bacterium]|nr:hypothetical protein [Candidatus Poribacteria bacterium]MYA98186.1 hypothetical protein [Candidatus Poribacteria bacterium]
MKLKSLIVYILSVLVFTIGCQQLNDQIKTGPDDPVSISVDDVNPDEIFYTGAVFVGDAGDRFGTDAYTLNSVTITDDTLNISVSYSGGCEAHQFTLVVSEEFLESFPVQLQVSIAHNANGDTCEAYPTENYRFDLTPIKTMYQAAYRQEAGTIILRLKDAPDGELVYEFTM